MRGILGVELEIGAFDRLSEADATAIAAREFGVVARRASRLDTERDDTFRLDSDAGGFVLKVAHPADSPSLIDLQTKALEHAGRADAALPLQRILPSRDGGSAPVLADHDNRVARLFDWLPGTPLHELEPGDAEFRALGTTLARLSLALRGFAHPAARRPFAWDLAQAAGLRPLLDLFPSDAAAEALDRFDELVAPRLGELDFQVIHNDFNPGNIVADPADPRYITGILDFGDVCFSPRVADLAVALSYLLSPFGRDWSATASFVDGFETLIPLTPLEHELLPDLVAARLAQRLLVNQWLDRESPDATDDLDLDVDVDVDVDASVQANLSALATLLSSTARIRRTDH